MRPVIAMALFPSLALADASVGTRPQPKPPLPAASSPWAKACAARLAEAHVQATAADKQFAQGYVDTSVGNKFESVSFLMPRETKDTHGDFSLVIFTESDGAFAGGVAPRKLMSPRLMSDGWYFFPNHPNHSLPPSTYAAHKSDRTAEIVTNGFSEAIERLWKRAAEDCLVLK
jgi:hypothetical protein